MSTTFVSIEKSIGSNITVPASLPAATRTNVSPTGWQDLQR